MLFFFSVSSEGAEAIREAAVTAAKDYKGKVCRRHWQKTLERFLLSMSRGAKCQWEDVTMCVVWYALLHHCCVLSLRSSLCKLTPM